jgi:hypothetical protein
MRWSKDSRMNSETRRKNAKLDYTERNRRGRRPTIDSILGWRAGVGGLGWVSVEEIIVWAVGAELSLGVSSGFLCSSDPLKDSHDRYIIRKILNLQ